MRKFSIGFIVAGALVASVLVAPGGAAATDGGQATASNIGVHHCLPGWVGVWPNCKKPCPPGWAGTYWPGCRPPCPKGWQGTFWPKCHPPCPKGWTGEFWPNCRPPKCPPGTMPPYCEKPPKHQMRKALMATRPPGL
jgi:hypothetical protein